MGTSQLAIINEALRALYAKLETQGEWGVNLDTTAADGRNIYLHLNDLFFSFDSLCDRAEAEALAERIGEFLPCTLDEVDEEGEVVAFEVNLLPVDEMSAALDKLFVDILELGDDYDLTWELMDMA